jgi:hypothetical protein
MRFCTKKACGVLLAMAVLATVQAARAQEEKPDDNTTPRARRDKADADKKQADDQPAKLLTMKDVIKMRRDKLSHDDIVGQAKQQGVAFEVTPTLRLKLRRMGFDDEQIAAMKDSYGPRPKPKKTAAENPDPIEPGKGLRTTGAYRDRVRAEVEQICKRSGAELSPVETVHFTLWAAKDIHKTFLPDIQKLEKMLETRFPEPIRSGLDKRSAHIVLIKRRYEYEKWIRALFEVCKYRYEQRGPQALTIQQQLEFALKSKGYYCNEWVVSCLEDATPDVQHRTVGTAVGYLYMVQLGQFSSTGPLCTGFASCLESTLAGSPTIMICGQMYGADTRNLAGENRMWINIVRQRIIAKQVTPVAELLKIDTSRMTRDHYAEAWTLVWLLANQPEKFAKLVAALQYNKSDLAVIKDVYGWDEKQLTAEWHKFVLAQR